MYNKPFLNPTEQLKLLKNRGLNVADDARAIEHLHTTGYYRLSAYWYPFRRIISAEFSRRSDEFLENSSFEDAIALYVFDKKFKLLLLDALERIEIAVRVEVALCLGARDQFAHMNPSQLHPNFLRHNKKGEIPYLKWKDKFNASVMRSQDEFILHHERKYGSRSHLPIWIAIELWDFGLLSHFFSGMQVSDRIRVAKRFSVPDWKLMESWLRSLNYVRNVIAHHGRLWNLNLVNRPILPGKGVISKFDTLQSIPNVNARIYSVCCILCHMSRAIYSDSSWPRQLREMINSFPLMPYAHSHDMGFPADWHQQALWQ